MSDSYIDVTIRIKNETAEHYMDVHEDLIFEDFISRHNNESPDIELVSVVKHEPQKSSTD